MATTHFRNITPQYLQDTQYLSIISISQAICLLLVICCSLQVKVINKRLQDHFWPQLLKI